MRLLLITLLFLGLNFSVDAQMSGTRLQCQLNTDQMLEMQSFSIDDPVSEDARYIFERIIIGLDELYLVTQGTNVPSPELIDAINSALTDARNLELNLSMLEEDLHYAYEFIGAKSE